MTDDALRLLAAGAADPGEIAVEGSLRPRTLDEYIGQREVKANLVGAAPGRQGRGEAADHVLLYGPPGLGKTTLATIIARELGVNVRYTSGPAIERAGDLAAILTALDERDVLFIDEIHRLNRAVEEILYPAMEDFALDVMIGKGPSARSLRLSLKPFTVVGATTRAGRISGPLRDRFGMTYRLDFYTEDDLAAIVRRSAGILDVRSTRDAARADRQPRSWHAPDRQPPAAARPRSRRGPRRRARSTSRRSPRRWRVLDIDDLGLDTTDRKLLAAIVQKFDSGPVGVQALAAVLAEEADTIEDVYEPFLLRLGLPRPHAPGPDRDRGGPGPPGRAGLRDPARRGAPSRTCPRCGTRSPAATERLSAGAARFEVLVPPPARRLDRAAPAGPPRRLPHGVVETPQFMPVGHQRHGQGPPSRTRSRRRAPRSSWPTPTTCSCAPATSGSSGSAGCIGSWAGTGRSSPTPAATRSCRSATCG